PVRVNGSHRPRCTTNPTAGGNMEATDTATSLSCPTSNPSASYTDFPKRVEKKRKLWSSAATTRCSSLVGVVLVISPVHSGWVLSVNQDGTLTCCNCTCGVNCSKGSRVCSLYDFS